MSLGRAKLLVHVVAVALGLMAGARVARAAAGQRLELTLGLGGGYDSNLLQYSDVQRDVFLAGTKPERYSIHSLDDATWAPSAGLQWTLDQGGGRRHIVRARFTGDFHSKNPTADYHELSASWRESFSGRKRLTIGIYSLPAFYLRQLIAEDYVPPFPGLDRHHRAQFALTIGSAAWSQRVARDVDAGLAYQLEGRHYNPDFRERDSKTHQVKARVGLSPGRRSLDVAVGYRWDRAKGEDGDEPESPADDDISYHGPIAEVGGEAELARAGARRLAGDLAYEIGSRSFDSDRPTDSYHFGRDDLIQAVEVGLRVSLRPHWSVRGYYRYENDNARLGVDAPPSSDVGSYHQHQAGLQIEWSDVLWRRTRGPETDAED